MQTSLRKAQEQEATLGKVQHQNVVFDVEI